MTLHRPAALFLSFSLTVAAMGQGIVHYPDNQHANPPQFAFPFYTPGVGSNGDGVRTQFHCPDTFLQSAGLTAGYVTSVGFSLAGTGDYDQFVLRAGTTAVASLGSDWTVNLPDHRVQLDLSGSTIVGGGSSQVPIAQWVDFELDFPFYYQPGDNIVVDLTSKLTTAGSLCGTTVGGGLVQRAYNFAYVPGALATNVNFNGIKVRFTFSPLVMLEFGSGCAGTMGLTPNLDCIGAPHVGTQIVVTADQATPNGLGLFLFGYSRRQDGALSLPLDLGGGCTLLVATDWIDVQTIAATGMAAALLTIPSTASLRGTVLYTQFAQFDSSSPASLPFALSEAGVLSVF